MFRYDGRRFRAVPDGRGRDDADAPVACYHQDGNTVWGEFTGGTVRKGSIAGTADPDGALHFGYCMVLADGELVIGRCDSLPELAADGRILLTEHWERFGPEPAVGVSFLEEVRGGTAHEPG